MKLILPKIESIVIAPHVQLYSDKSLIKLLWGGRYGAKSEDVSRIAVLKCLSEKKFRCIIARKVKDTIKDSIYQNIKKVIEQANLTDFFRFKVNPLEILCVNGNGFFARGFDDPQKIKSFNQPTTIIIEEASETDEKDFNTALTTLRGIENPEIWMMFNPEFKSNYEEHYIYTKFFENVNLNDVYNKTFKHKTAFKVDDKEFEFDMISVHTTYKDNPFLKDISKAIVEGYKNEFETKKTNTSKYYYKVWTLGEFGNKLNELQYLNKFSEPLHVQKISFDKDLPVYITFDKNVNPYITGLILQTYNRYDIAQVEEFCLRYPNNRTRKLAETIAEYLIKKEYTGIVRIYGDATAKNDDTNSQLGQNFYTIITDILKQYGFQVENCVPGIRSNKQLDIIRTRKNPNTIDRADFFNEILSNNLNGYSFEISNECRTSINDYNNAKQAPDGSLDKKERDDQTKGEKYGHCTDALLYFICEYCYKEYTDFSKKRKKYAG